MSATESILLCLYVRNMVLLNRDVCCFIFFFQAEDGIRDLVRSRGLGDVYKRQAFDLGPSAVVPAGDFVPG